MEEEKVVYDPIDIQRKLGMGKTKTYDFLELVHRNRQPFIVRKVGKLYKIPKHSFDAWINGENE